MNHSLRVISVPCLKDNYAYLVSNAQGDAIVIDPGEAAPVRAALSQHQLSLKAILNTHHHYDHVGGNLELSDGRLPIYAFQSDEGRVPGLTHPLQDGEEFEVLGEAVRALHVPGHTLGALTYQFEGFAFTGDTIFCAGAGRLFEGTAEQMNRAFEQVAKTLSPDDLLYTGHEYTAANLRFALSLWPEDEAVKKRLAQVEQERSQGKSCASASLAEELETNPFFRVRDADYREQLGLGAMKPVDAFAEVRRRKDQF